MISDVPPREILMIFARAPEPGRVKTRLIPGLGEALACAFHAACVADVCERHARHAAGLGGRRQVVVWLAGGDDVGEFEGLSGLALPVRRQVGADLGERMANAFAAELARAPRVAIIGTDSPTLDPARVDEAFEALNTADVAVGPAEDGGYYLLAARDHVPPCFVGPVWGSERVLADTVHRLDRAGVRYAELEPSFDVDRPEDLDRLRWEVRALTLSGGAVPERVAAVLEAMLAAGGGPG